MTADAQHRQLAQAAEEMTAAAALINIAKHHCRNGTRIERQLQFAYDQANASVEQYALDLDGSPQMYTARRQVIQALTMTSNYQQTERLCAAVARISAAYTAYYGL